MCTMAEDRGLLVAETRYTELTCGSENLSPYSASSGYGETPSYYHQHEFDWQQQQQHQQLHTQQQHHHTSILHPSHQQALDPPEKHFYSSSYHDPACSTPGDTTTTSSSGCFPGYGQQQQQQQQQVTHHPDFYSPAAHGLWPATTTTTLGGTPGTTSPESLVAAAQMTQHHHHRFFSGIDLTQHPGSHHHHHQHHPLHPLHPHSQSGGVVLPGAGGVAGGAPPVAVKPKRKRVQSHTQRKAANVRERRRMFHLNEAFDELRKRLPAFNYEKRLSRIETLRLAMTYISFMKDVSVGEDPKSIKLRPHGAELSPLGGSHLLSSLFSGSGSSNDERSLINDDSDDDMSNHSGGN